MNPPSAPYAPNFPQGGYQPPQQLGGYAPPPIVSRSNCLYPVYEIFQMKFFLPIRDFSRCHNLIYRAINQSRTIRILVIIHFNQLVPSFNSHKELEIKVSGFHLTNMAMKVFLSSISEWSIGLEQKLNLSSGFNQKIQIQRLNYHYYWFFYSKILTSVGRFRNSIEWIFFHYHVILVLTKDFLLRSQVNKIANDC